MFIWLLRTLKWYIYQNVRIVSVRDMTRVDILINCKYHEQEHVYLPKIKSTISQQNKPNPINLATKSVLFNKNSQY